MQLSNLFQVREQLNLDGIILYYAGQVSQGLVEEVGEIVKQNINLESTPSISQRVFSVFIEQIQNLMNYSAERRVDAKSQIEYRSGVTVIGKSEGEFYVVTGNLIENRQKDILIQKLEQIKTLDKEGLKKLYKEQIKSDQNHAESKGAGLGFIDIARKASKPIEYDINEVDGDYSFFCLKVYI